MKLMIAVIVKAKDLVYELLLNVHFPKKMKVMLMLSKICMESF